MTAEGLTSRKVSLKTKLQEITLYLNGWQKFEGKWIHPSGKNKFPRTTEEAVAIAKGLKPWNSK